MWCDVNGAYSGLVTKVRCTLSFLLPLPSSAEGSHTSGQSNGRDHQALAKAVQVHQDTLRTMYFA